jgi:hypothetical protein
MQTNEVEMFDVQEHREETVTFSNSNVVVVVLLLDDGFNLRRITIQIGRGLFTGRL